MKKTDKELADEIEWENISTPYDPEDDPYTMKELFMASTGIGEYTVMGCRDEFKAHLWLDEEKRWESDIVETLEAVMDLVELHYKATRGRLR